MMAWNDKHKEDTSFDWPGFYGSCHGKWRDIVRACGMGEVFLTGKNTKCPFCGGKDRWRWNIEMDLALCEHCSTKNKGINGWEICERITGLKSIELANHIQGLLGNCQMAPVNQPSVDKTPHLKTMYRESRPMESGDPVWLYMEKRRIIPCTYKALRYHPSLKHPDGGRHPAILALMGWDGAKYSGIHRTYLTMDGDKAKVDSGRVRLAYGSMGVVELGEVTDGRLGIAEGIETALSASQLFGMPVWSALNAGMLEEFKPPSNVTKLCIFGDNDAGGSFRGQKAAYTLANRVSGIEVHVEIPDEPGTDWNDYLKQVHPF